MDADSIPLAFDIFPGNQNDPSRFIRKTAVTEDGEPASKCVYSLDQECIDDEAVYDDFYAVITNLEDNIGEILKINRQRWEIEENFRIMKSELEARPVFARREDRYQISDAPKGGKILFLASFRPVIHNRIGFFGRTMDRSPISVFLYLWIVAALYL